MQLSYVQRVILANQYKILSSLYEGSSEAESYSKIQESLENGYELYYEDALHWQVFEDELTKEDCRLVIRAMDMYWAMQISYERLEDQTGIKKEDLYFPGFDGNNETKFLGYTQFIVEREGRFTSLKFEKDQHSGAAGGTDRYNSHWPVVDLYRNRVNYWQQLPNSYELSQEDILALLEIR